MSTAIKVYDESMPGAPVLGSGAGTELAVLYACLCTGFGQRSATITVAGGVATVTTANEPKNANMLHTVILVEGVTGALAALNGEQKITAATATTLQFATSEADGTAAGTITIKTAPAGWQRVFNDDTNHVAVFKSNDPQSPGKYLRVDGSNSQYTYVRGYSNMTDVNTGTAPFPPATVADASFRWYKSQTAGTDYQWEVYADNRAFYYVPAIVPGVDMNMFVYFFGDFVRENSAEQHNCVLTSSGGQSFYTGYSLPNETARSGPYCWLAKSPNGVGDGVVVSINPIGGRGFSGDENTLGNYPSATGKLLLVKLAVIYSDFRGVLPGIYFVPQKLFGTNFARKSTELDNNGATVRVITSVLGAGSMNNKHHTRFQRMFIQITGGWR